MDDEVEESTVEDSNPDHSLEMTEELVETNDVEEMDAADVSSEPLTANADASSEPLTANADASSEPLSANADAISEALTANAEDVLENKVMVPTLDHKNGDDIESSSSEREDSEMSEVPASTPSLSDMKLALKESSGAEQLYNSSAGNTPIDDETFDMNSVLISPKVPVKVKSRWRRTSELEQVVRNGSWDQSSCNSSPLAMSPRAALNPPLRSEEKCESIKEKV